MADVLTSEQRHHCMSQVKNKNTKPEIIVRKFLFANGFRFRINKINLPGKPDVVLPKYKTAIFVNGCFWHGHFGCKYSKLPSTNQKFWEVKINGNIERDIATKKSLETDGWKVIVVWQCQLKPKVKDITLSSLIQKIIE